MGEALAADVGEVQVAEDVEAVVDRDDDHVLARGEVGAVEARPVGRAVGEGAAVQPDHHRPLHAVVQTRRPDMRRQAILADLARRPDRQGDTPGAPPPLSKRFRADEMITRTGTAHTRIVHGPPPPPPPPPTTT